MKKTFLAALLLTVSASVAVAATGSTTTPEFGKHCATGLVMGKKVMTDCSINWVDPATHKTYCFSSEEMKKEWAKDTKTHIAKSTETFAGLAKAKVDSHMGH